MGDGERRYGVWWAGDARVREEGRDERERPVSLYVETAQWRRHEERGAVTNALDDPAERMNSELAWMLLGHGRFTVDPHAHVDRHEAVAGREAIVLRLPEREAPSTRNALFTIALALRPVIPTWLALST